MASLSETSAFAGLHLPVTLAGCRLHPLAPARITALAPYPGQTAALRNLLGSFPDPGQVVTLAETRLVWAGRDLAFAFGPDLPMGLEPFCALTDQSDAWVGLSLHGPGAEAHLARRLPFDLRKLPAPGSARSLLDHLPVLILRMGPEAFEIWVWRSMVGSAVPALTGP